jgi:hypothetical protein
MACGIIHDLGVRMPCTAEYAKPWSLHRSEDFFSDSLFSF